MNVHRYQVWIRVCYQLSALGVIRAIMKALLSLINWFP